MAPADGSDTWDPDPPANATWDGDDTPSSPAEEARYEQGPVVGSGGLADVRSALDRRLGREVAVKRLRNPLRTTARARFLREARVAAQLEHPGIVPVHDVDVDADGVPFYTMRYVRGEPMDQALARARTLQQRLALLPAFVAVCQAMAYAHERGVVHRDLKPHNVMLGPFGESVVVDWGLARNVDHPDLPDEPTRDDTSEEVDASALTRVGVVTGTPAYMAPEQARGEPVGLATDVYALGAMPYELLTGRTPRSGTGTVEQQLEQARRAEHPAVLALQPDCPRDLAAIAERALSAAAADRYPSAAGMWADLERWTQGRFVEAHHYTTVERLAHLYRRYRVPVWLGLLGATATAMAALVGVVNTAAERDRAVANEALAVASAAEARQWSASLLGDRAARALEDGDLLAARAYAVASLGLGESPEARGVLLASWGAPSLQALPPLPLPHPCRSSSGRATCSASGPTGSAASPPTARSAGRWRSRWMQPSAPPSPWTRRRCGWGPAGR